MKGWVLYKRSKQELTAVDHGVNRFLSVATRLGIELEVYRPNQFELIASPDQSLTVFLDGKAAELPDFLLPRLGSDTTYHTLALIRQFELAGVYCANGSSAVDIAKDKLYVGQLLVAHQLPTPKTMLLNFPVSIPMVEHEIGFPLVIKTISGARGLGVYLCETASSFRDLLGLLDEHRSQQLLVQRFITSSYGRDLRVFVLNSRVIGCMLRVAKNSFKANYSLGGDVSAFPVNAEIERLALASTHLVGLDIAGVDLLFGLKDYFVCEVNSSPGFKGMELATGEDVATQIIEHCMSACL